MPPTYYSYGILLQALLWVAVTCTSHSFPRPPPHHPVIMPSHHQCIGSVAARADQENKQPPTKYGVVLFPGFQALDLFGPLDILNLLSVSIPLRLSIMSTTLDPVSTLVPAFAPHAIGQSIVPTHTFETAPRDIEVLIVPGGMGTRRIQDTQPAVNYIRETYPHLRYILTVCTGSVLLARTGFLDGKQATSNKHAFTWAEKQVPNVKWIHRARWVTDDNFWTSSGISAGLDMTYAFLADQYGMSKAKEIAWLSEYEWNDDSRHDPFGSDQ